MATSEERQAEYWKNRQGALQDRLLNKGEAFHKDYLQVVQNAIDEYERIIEQFYARFAIQNEMTYAEAKRILTSDERKKFQMTLQNYVKKGKTLGISDKWAKQLENASTVFRISRIRALQIELQNQIETMMAALDDGLKAVAGEIYTEGYYRQIYEIQTFAGAGYSFTLVDPAMIETLVAKPWAVDGKTFSTRIWDNRDTLMNFMNQRVQQAFMTGEDKRKLIRDLQNEFGHKQGKNAGRLIMTEAAFYSSQATLNGYKSQGVEKYEFIATLEKTTCDLCGGQFDGKVFPVSEYQAGVNAPPLHAHCRCHTAPLITDDIFADVFAQVYGAKGTRSAQDDEGVAYKVPKNTTWREWKQKYAHLTAGEI